VVKTAFMFPGQGSQSVGMLADLVDSAPARAVFAQASEVLGYDLWELIASDPEERLGQTEFTQPALLTSSVALWQLAQESGQTPDVILGHSLGEYSALVAGGVIGLADGVALVQKRGQFMQSAVPVGVGGMAAILGLDDDVVTEICVNVAGDEVVQPANHNAPGQIVIAGHMGALERAIGACQEAGAKRAVLLAVSAPFHSVLLKPAADRMADELARVEFSAPACRLIQNVHAGFESDPNAIRDNLVRQIYNPVLWSASIATVAEAGIECIVECGPGKVLTGLTRRIDKRLKSLTINDQASLAKATEELAA
jgi:[acyl-carrier-protein] S-malonyltransferase